MTQFKMGTFKSHISTRGSFQNKTKIDVNKSPHAVKMKVWLRTNASRTFKLCNATSHDFLICLKREIIISLFDQWSRRGQEVEHKGRKQQGS